MPRLQRYPIDCQMFVCVACPMDAHDYQTKRTRSRSRATNTAHQGTGSRVSEHTSIQKDATSHAHRADLPRALAQRLSNKDGGQQRPLPCEIIIH